MNTPKKSERPANRLGLLNGFRLLRDLRQVRSPYEDRAAGAMRGVIDQSLTLLNTAPWVSYNALRIVADASEARQKVRIIPVMQTLHCDAVKAIIKVEPILEAHGYCPEAVAAGHYRLDFLCRGRTQPSNDTMTHA